MTRHATRLFNLETKEEIAIWGEYTNDFVSACFSPDGEYILTGGNDAVARLWHIESGEQTIVLSGHTQMIQSVAISRHMQYALTGSQDGTARIWDLSSGEQLQLLSGHENPVAHVQFSPDGELVLSAGREVHLWSLSTGELMQTGPESDYFPTSVSFSPDSHYVLEERLGFATIWGIKSHGRNPIVPHSNMELTSAAFSPDGRYLLADSYNENLIYLWEYTHSGDDNRWVEIAKFDQNPRAESLAISSDNQFFVVGESGGIVRLRDIHTGDVVRVFSGLRLGTYHVELAPNGEFIFAQSIDGSDRLWAIDIQDRKSTIDDAVIKGFSRDGRFILASASDGTTQIWDLDAVTLRHTFSNDSKLIVDLDISVDGKKLLIGNTDGTVRLIDVETGQRIHDLSGHEDSITDVQISQDGNLALTGSRDRTARLWDTMTGETIHVFSHIAGAENVEISTDNRYALTSTGQLVFLWDLLSGTNIDTFHHQQRITDVAFSPDGHYVLTGDSYHLFRLWDLWDNGEMVYELSFTGGILNFVFSADGGAIAVSDFLAQENRIFIIETESGNIQRVIEVNDNPIQHMVFSGDGQYVITGSDNVIKHWEVNHHDFLKYACSHMPRDFYADGTWVFWEVRAQHGIFDDQPTCPQFTEDD